MPKNDYVISLKKAYDGKPRKRRVNYAVRIVYDFLKKHTRKEKNQIVISEEVNNCLWSRSIHNPPRKINVSLRFKDDFVYVFLKDSKNAKSFLTEKTDKKEKKEKTKVKETKEETPKTETPKTEPEKPKETKEEELKTETPKIEPEKPKETKEEKIKEDKNETK